MEKDRIIECIAQENWEHFCEAIEQTKEARTGKKIIIFGSLACVLLVGFLL